MDLRLTEAETAFRAEVREFLQTAQPQSLRRKMELGQMPSREDLVGWHRILETKGWAAPMWPVEWGGAGWNVVQFYIFSEELLRTPALPPHPHVNQIGPVIATFGSEDMKRRFLKKIRTMEYYFCSGLSEPGAGSDLAALKTQAVLDGDHYVVNGQKLWTTLAHHANWMYALVRTDPRAKKQQGISFLLIDMTTPGISVRPLDTLTGARSVNEVFFDNVRVPVENRIGEENRGWTYIKHTLGVERMTQAKIGSSKGKVAFAKQLAATAMTEHGPLSENVRFRQKLAEIEVDLKALEMTNLRMVDHSMKHGGGNQDPKMSILKLGGSLLHQATLEILMEVAGPQAMARQVAFLEAMSDDIETIGPKWAATIPLNYYHGRAASIFGGSNEIQHNILAKAALGL